MMMRALTAMTYDGRQLKAGELFEPDSAATAHTLTLAQLAVEVDDLPPKKKYKTRMLRAEDE